METDSAPKYETISNIDYHRDSNQTEPSLVTTPTLADNPPVADETQRDNEVSPTLEANDLSARDQPTYADSIVHAHTVLAHPQTQILNEENRLVLGEAQFTQTIYSHLNVHDVLPLEIARVRLLSLIVDHFIQYHIVPASSDAIEKSNEKSKKRRIEEIDLQNSETSKLQYEGDPNYILPLLFVVNAYESLVSVVNRRIAEIEGLQGKSIGLALEAAGGLYRRLIEKYPKSGSITTFKRRELASADEARKRFPELVGTDEKRVRFIVVHGLELVDRPSMAPEDAQWFCRVTGRSEATLYPSDYRFFSQRTKTRRASITSASAAQPTLMLTNVVNSLDKNNSLPHFQPRSSPSRSRSLSPSHSQPHSQSQSHIRQQQQHQQHQLSLQYQEHNTVNGHVTTTQHNLELMSRLARQSSNGRPATVIRFCDECGAQYVRDASKYCSECGTKRFVL